MFRARLMLYSCLDRSRHRKCDRPIDGDPMTKEFKATPSEDVPSRKNYATPKLVIYGNISQITQSQGKGKANDGMPNKSQ